MCWSSLGDIRFEACGIVDPSLETVSVWQTKVRWVSVAADGRAVAAAVAVAAVVAMMGSCVGNVSTGAEEGRRSRGCAAGCAGDH